MRYQFHLAFVALHLVSSAPASAQIVNGSFEDASGFTIYGWSGEISTTLPTVGGTVPINEGAPGWGSWSAAPSASQSYNYWMDQQVPQLTPGDIYALSFWAKCPHQYFMCACVYLNGSNNPAVCTNEPVWTQVTITDTVPNTGILGIRLKTRSTGSTGHQNPTPAYIDGVSLQVVGHVEVQEQEFALDAIIFDADSRLLRVQSLQEIQGLRISDTSGRTVQQFGRVLGGQVTILQVNPLPAGVYIAIAEGRSEHQALRIIMP